MTMLPGKFSPAMPHMHLSMIALRFLALLATMERGFSVARHAASEWQMAMLPETLGTRMLIQAN
jgi:hypothetical protein